MQGRLGDYLMIVRYHIVLVAMTACVTFGWIFTGRYLWVVALLCGADWFVINLLNRITDLAEDEKNAIPGTARVRGAQGALFALCLAVLVTTLAITFVWFPGLLLYRVAVQAIGVAYNYRVVPAPASLRWPRPGEPVPVGIRMSRFKEMYFFKNFGSAVLFVLTCFAYPLAAVPEARAASFVTVATLMLFFVPYELTFEDVEIPVEDRLGEEGQGFALCEKWLVEGRVPYAAGTVGIAQEALEIAIAWARERTTFGSRLADKQAIQWMIADSEMELRAARLLVYQAAWEGDLGREMKTAASIAKVVGTETAGRVIDRCIQIMGALGVAKELPLERWYREMRIKRIGEGPSEVHRMVLARQLLGGR